MSKSGATTKPVQSVATERLTVGRALALTVTENDARACPRRFSDDSPGGLLREFLSR
jgi:hypothetical protein